MKQLIAMLVAAAFAGASFAAIANEQKPPATPTADQCKKDPKMKGCPQPKAGSTAPTK